MCYSPNLRFSFWFPLKISKSQSQSECLKVLAACSETNASPHFLDHREKLTIFENLVVKSIYTCLHTYNENLELLAELHISALT